MPLLIAQVRLQDRCEQAQPSENSRPEALAQRSCERSGLTVDFQPLASTNAGSHHGFARIMKQSAKRRIADSGVSAPISSAQIFHTLSTMS